jgi:hypothetical protein
MIAELAQGHFFLGDECSDKIGFGDIDPQPDSVHPRLLCLTQLSRKQETLPEAPIRPGMRARMSLHSLRSLRHSDRSGHRFLRLLGDFPRSCVSSCLNHSTAFAGREQGGPIWATNSCVLRAPRASPLPVFTIPGAPAQPLQLSCHLHHPQTIRSRHYSVHSYGQADNQWLFRGKFDRVQVERASKLRSGR